MTTIHQEPVIAACAWTAAELAADSGWVYPLAPDEIQEIERALIAVRKAGIPTEHIRPHNFPLPRLAARLDAIWEQLENGRGIALLRGVPVARYDVADIERIYCGLASHLGIPIPQNSRGDHIGHVRDTGARWGEQREGELVRGYLTTAYLPFHSDSADLVALLCVQKAKAGGLSSVVSSTAIFNELLATRPDLLRPLFRGFHYSLRGETGDGVDQVSSHRVPVFSFHAGKLSARYVRKTIQQAGDSGGVAITAEETAALDAIDALAKSDRLRFDMHFEPGDIQCLNNFVAFHSRSAFEDWDEPARKRHLLRIWMHAPRGRELVRELKQLQGEKSVFLTRAQAIERDRRLFAEA